MLPHLDAAYNLARWLVRDASIAEDVVQDAYERACRYFAAFRGGSGRAWLLQIVRNAAYSTLKAQRQRMEVSLSAEMHAAAEDGLDMDMPDSSPGPEATVAQRQDLAALDDALNALPSRMARVSHPARSGGPLVQGDGADLGRSDRNGHVAPLARAPGAPADSAP